MRLIDADKLPYVSKVILVDQVDGDVIITIAKEYTSYVNDETPTVKAIPVEFIKKYYEGITMPHTDTRIQFEEMIRKWEKENEQKDNDRLILKAWKKTTLTKEELEKAFEDDEFNEYIQMLINKEFEKRLKKKLGI